MSEDVPYIRALLPDGSLPIEAKTDVEGLIDQRMAATVIELGTNLDDVTEPGMYVVAGTYPESTTALNYPSDGFSGTIEVYGRTVGNVGLRQVASGRSFASQSASIGLAQYQRTRYAGVWSPWVDMNLDGSPSARQIFAPGRPDLPATTPYTAAQLNAVPSGHKYISLDGPQGAWEWQKRGSAWVCIELDTGELDISSLLNPGFELQNTQGRFRLSRTNHMVTLKMRIEVGADSPLIGTSRSIRVALCDLPPGFRSTTYAHAGTVAGTAGASATVGDFYFPITLNRPEVAYPIGTWAAGNSVQGVVTWPTDDPVPTTLTVVPA